MNAERLIREVEKRLLGLSESARAEVLDALREELARERRRAESDPSATIEGERARRVEAETLREILEAINRQARLVDTIEEVLKQLGRIVVYDSCSLSLLEPDGKFRVLAGRGLTEPDNVIGATYQSAFSDEIRDKRGAISMADVSSDERFVQLETKPVRSWAGLPLLIEGEVIGLLSINRRRVEPFDEEDVHRAKAVAFSAAAAIRKARLLEQVRRYAALMERTVAVDQAVFTNRSKQEVARIILEGAAHLGSYPAGLLAIDGPEGARVVATVGDCFADAHLVGKTVSASLDAKETARIAAAKAPEISRDLGVKLPAEDLYLVPVATADRHVGTLVLVDPNGETADDRMMEAYASRAATAYLYAQSHS